MGDISKRNAPQKLKATDLTQKIIWLGRAQRVREGRKENIIMELSTVIMTALTTQRKI